MKDILKGIMEPVRGDLAKLCVAREYLQARVLESLQDQGVFQNWAFVGGTALRFLFSIRRFSEDLDFSMVEAGRESGFDQAVSHVESSFKNEAYEVTVTSKSEMTVASAFLKFPGLLYEIGLSRMRSQVLSIKIEVDTNPPRGAVLESTLVRRHVTLHLMHYDRASLLAGKLHAILTRRYTKGRDVYDLVWYLADRSWPAPNLALLNSALAQTGWKGPVVTVDNWRRLIVERMKAINWANVSADVRPFLEHSAEADLITQENVLSVLRE